MLSKILLVVAALLAIAGLVTMIPVASTGNTSDLGYHSLCPFAPWSSLALLVPAALVWGIRSHFNTTPREP